MNKKVLIIIALIFVPTILAAVWFVSMSTNSFTPGNVASIVLRDADGNEWSYTENENKQFFTDISKNLKPIIKQEFEEDVWKLYELEFERAFDTVKYFLCLSHNANNCLAYDEEGKWYKISPEYAKSFLVREELQSVYDYKDYPKLTVTSNVTSNSQGTELEAIEYDWNYVLADNKSFHDETKTNADKKPQALFLLAEYWATFSFSVTPDWTDVKIFEDDALIFSGDVETVSSFSYDKDSNLKVVVCAKWYEDESRLYYGSTTTEFSVQYDARAEASLDKESYSIGEIAFISLKNAEFDGFTISTDLIMLNENKSRAYLDAKYILFPISCENASGDYEINLTAKTNRTLNLNIIDKALETADVKLKNATADEYEEALKNFDKELGLEGVTRIEEPLWKEGFVTPVIKYVDDKECYWISSPSYGVPQRVGNKDISVKNFGIHYVKSVDVESISARAVADGKILFNGVTTAFGNTVVVDHGAGLFSVFGHIDECILQVGDTVKKGDIIGESSNNGIMMYDEEIFFGMMLDGIFINPFTLINEQRSSLDNDTTDAPSFFTENK